MKFETKKKIKSITLSILEILGSLGVAMMSLPMSKRQAFKMFAKQFDGSTRDGFNHHLRNLERRGYLEIDRRNSDSVMFTDKAKIKLIESMPMEEDGMFRFVSFDIPEDSRNRRDQFRAAIKRMGFKQIQKSLWVTNRNVGEMVDIAAREYKVEEYVVYIISKSTNIDGYIEKKFERSLSV